MTFVIERGNFRFTNEKLLLLRGVTFFKERDDITHRGNFLSWLDVTIINEGGYLASSSVRSNLKIIGYWTQNKRFQIDIEIHKIYYTKPLKV